MKRIAIPLALLVCAMGLRAQGALTLIDFETFPNGSTVPFVTDNLSNQWSSLGLLIQNGTDGYGASAYDAVYGFSTHSGLHGIGTAPGGNLGVPLSFLFVVPTSLDPGMVTAAGLWIANSDSGSSTATFLGPNNSVLYTVQTTGPEFYAGYTNASGIYGIRITDPDLMLVDDFQFGPVSPVPEPRTWAVLLAAALAFGLRRRGKN